MGPEQPLRELPRETPKQVVGRIREERALGGQMNPAQILGDVLLLGEMGVEKQSPVLWQWLQQEIGGALPVRTHLLGQLREADTVKNRADVQRYLEIAHLLGYDNQTTQPKTAWLLSSLADLYGEPPPEPSGPQPEAQDTDQARLAEIRAQLQQVQEEAAAGKNVTAQAPTSVEQTDADRVWEQFRQERIQQAVSEFPHLFPKDGPLTLTDNLVEQRGITGIILLAEYQGKLPDPDGLGMWIRQRSDFEKDAPPVAGWWVEYPRPGSTVVIKIARYGPQAEGQLAAERWALTRLKDSHIEDATARPVKMYGYGVTKDRSGSSRPYLILEYIGGDFQPLDEYFKDKGERLSEQEALEITIKTCVALNKLHKNQSLHNDINSQKLDNIFWDPKQKRVRLIDFANASNQGVDLGFVQKRSYFYDRQGVGSLLFKLVTGDPFPVGLDHPKYKSWEDFLNREYSQINPQVRNIIAWTQDVERYNKDQPEDTEKLLGDLQLAYRAVKPL